MINRGMIECTGEKRKGHLNGRMQLVRRVLPPPFIDVVDVKTESLLLVQVRNLRRMADRMKSQGVWVDDGVRLSAIVSRLEVLIK